MADGGYGQYGPNDSTSTFAQHDFHITQRLARVRTMTPVKVISVKAGGIAAYSTVVVQPQIKQMDGQGNVVSHGQVYNIPVIRWGGGDSSIIMDPVAGDMGWIGISDRDISSFKTSLSESAPGSRRRFSFSDAVYLGKIGGAAPAQYIIFDSTGVKIVDRNGNIIYMKAGEVDITAPKVVFSGNVVVDGNLQLGGSIQSVAGSEYTNDISTSGNVVAGAGGADSVGLTTHGHPGNNEPPNPGT
jgi:hypothetical protein